MEWSEAETAFTKSAFYIGYVVFHIPGGLLSDMLGGRIIIAWSTAISMLGSFLIPLIAHAGGPYAVAFCRIVVGSAQGMFFPALSSLLAAWVPKEERSFLGAFAMSGSHVGTITSNAITGLLSSIIGAEHKWSAPIYFWVVASGIYLIIHLVWVYSYPSTHPNITEEEKAFIESSLRKS